MIGEKRAFIVPAESDSFEAKETFDADLTTEEYILNEKQTNKHRRETWFEARCYRSCVDAYAAGFAIVCMILLSLSLCLNWWKRKLSVVDRIMSELFFLREVLPKHRTLECSPLLLLF